MGVMTSTLVNPDAIRDHLAATEHVWTLDEGGPHREAVHA